LQRWYYCHYCSGGVAAYVASVVVVVAVARGVGVVASVVVVVAAGTAFQRLAQVVICETHQSFLFTKQSIKSNSIIPLEAINP